MKDAQVESSALLEKQAGLHAQIVGGEQQLDAVQKAFT